MMETVLRQVLKNQLVIMHVLFSELVLDPALELQIQETEKLLSRLTPEYRGGTDEPADY